MTVTKEAWFGVCTECVAWKCGVMGRKEDWKTKRSQLELCIPQMHPCGLNSPKPHFSHQWTRGSQNALFSPTPSVSGMGVPGSDLPSGESPPWGAYERVAPSFCIFGTSSPAAPAMESRVGTPAGAALSATDSFHGWSLLCWPEGEFSRLLWSPLFVSF